MEPGEIFEDEYRIVGQLGTGGQSKVYRAADLTTGRRVAIKLLHHHGDGVRFIREGRVVSRLKSPYIVRLISFARAASGQFYMVFEFVPGEDLAILARREAPIEWPRVARLMRQVLEALAEAHEMGIVHRDIKPSNIMITPSGDAKVLDFGVARLDESEGKNLTETGEVLGTPRYVSPEALHGGKVTPAADVYAVGLVAWELLVGRPANDARNGSDIVLRHLDPTPYRLPLELDIDDDVRRWVSTMVNKIPDRRPEDAAEALVDLNAFDEPPPPLVAQDAPTSEHDDDPDMDSVETQVLGADDSDEHEAPTAERPIAIASDETADPTDPNPWPAPDITEPDPWIPEIDVALEPVPAPPPPQVRSSGPTSDQPPPQMRSAGRPSAAPVVSRPKPAAQDAASWSPLMVKGLIVIAIALSVATIGWLIIR